MSPQQTNPSPVQPGNRFLGSVLVVAVLFGLFVIIYIISRQTPTSLTAATGAAPEDQWKFSNEGRAGRLAELRAKEQTAATTYGWVDQKTGVVRLPIDRAVELTIRELGAPKR